MVGFKVGYEVVPGEGPSQRRVIAYWMHTHRRCVVVELEVNLVSGTDTEAISELLRYDDLPLRPNPVSHTAQYNFRRRVLRPSRMARSFRPLGYAANDQAVEGLAALGLGSTGRWTTKAVPS